MQRLSWLISALIILIVACRGDEHWKKGEFTPFLKQESAWVNSTLDAMSTEEKIGQLIVLEPGPDRKDWRESIFQWVAEGKIGGMLLRELPLPDFLNIVDTARQVAPLPLFFAAGESALLNSQFSDLHPFPSAMTIHANPSDSLKEQIHALFAKQAVRLGINLALAPEVSQKGTEPGIVIGQGALGRLNERRILALAPQTGSIALEVRPDTNGVYDGILSPYRELINAGVSGFLIDPDIFFLDDFEERPENFLGLYFSEELNFRGLIAARLTPENCLEQLLHAGVDVFLVENPAFVFQFLKEAVESRLLPMRTLDEKVRKILKAKAWMHTAWYEEGLPGMEAHSMKALNTSMGNPGEESTGDSVALLTAASEVAAHFYDRQWEACRWLLYEQSIVVVNNRNGLLPFGRLYRRGFRVQQFGERPLSVFTGQFERYADHTTLHHTTEKGKPLAPLSKTNVTTWTTIITLDSLELDAGRDAAFIQSVADLARMNRVVLINFGNPANLIPFDTTVTLVQIFERNAMTESLAAQTLFGAIPTRGKLPFGINDYFQKGRGFELTPTRLKYALPQEVSIAPEKLVSINAIVGAAIKDGAMPGAQVLVAKEGKIIYSQAFGNHTYKNGREVKATDLYDVASITKIAATTLAAMKLYDDGRLSLEDRIHEHLECDKQSTIRNILVGRLLTHQSGLPPNLPILPYVMSRGRNNANCRKYFCRDSSDVYSVKVAESFYFKHRDQAEMLSKIHRMPVAKRRRTRYSDVNFVLLQQIMENETKQRLDIWLNTNMYYPLGLRNTAFLPLQTFSRERIVPTQNDEKWRRQLVHGHVHDETAALLGGVAGHAGLFSNAEDLAVIFQMMLNGGSYGGKRYLNPETVKLFTSTRPGTYRGLGFDKPRANLELGYSRSASGYTYGHTGFTGTCVWVDPEHDLIFIFLSNRVHPKISNRAFSQKKVRERIHQVVYDALNTFEIKMPDLPEEGIVG